MKELCCYIGLRQFDENAVMLTDILNFVNDDNGDFAAFTYPGMQTCVIRYLFNKSAFIQLFDEIRLSDRKNIQVQLFGKCGKACFCGVCMIYVNYVNRRWISMELRVLTYFLAVVGESNFTKAAEKLHVTQPTLSRQIAQLEKELGVKLFNRGSHSVSLTDDGMILKRRAEEIINIADRTKHDFLCKGENLEGTICIGSGEFLSTNILTDCIASFRKKYPRVKYEFYSGNAKNIRDNAERGLIDFGLMSEPIDVRKYEFITMPVKEQWGAFVRKDSPLAKKETLSPQDLTGIPLVSAVSDFAQSNIGKWFGEYVTQTNIIAEGNLLYNEVVLAQSCFGAAVGIRLRYEYEGLRFIPFSPTLESGTALAWEKNRVFSAAAAAFIEFSKKYIKGIANNVL